MAHLIDITRDGENLLLTLTDEGREAIAEWRTERGWSNDDIIIELMEDWRFSGDYDFIQGGWLDFWSDVIIDMCRYIMDIESYPRTLPPEFWFNHMWQIHDPVDYLLEWGRMVFTLVRKEPQYAVGYSFGMEGIWTLKGARMEHSANLMALHGRSPSDGDTYWLDFDEGYQAGAAVAPEE